MSEAVRSMMRKSVVAFLILGVALPVVRANDAMKDALSAVPEDAIGFLCVPSIKELDAKVKATLTKLGLAEIVPPPMNSVAGLLRTYLGMSAGLDEAGPLIVLQMSADSPAALANRQAFLVPASDPKALLEAMGAKPGEGEQWTLQVMGRPSYAAIGQKRVILAQTPDVVAAISASKGSIQGKLKAKDLKAFEGLDLALWVDGERLIKLVKPLIDMFVGMFGAGAGSNPLAAKQMEATKKNIDMFVDGSRAMLFGMSLGEKGLGLRFTLATKPGSELARRTSGKGTTGPLLQGLPGGEFILALGETVDPSQSKDILDAWDPYFSMGEDVESINKEQLGAFKAVLQEWIPLWTGFRVSVRMLPAGPAGMVGADLVLGTSDSQKWLELLGKAVEAGKKVSTDEEFIKVVETITYRTDAEEIGGIKTHHLKWDVAKLEETEEEDVEQMTKVLGQDGLLFRIAAADAKHVVISMGGGAERAQRSIEQAKKSDAPLDDQPGIKSVAANLPAERYMAGYLAVDKLLTFVNAVAKAVDEEALPFPIPDLNAPIGMTGSGGEEWGQADIFFPMELMVATKNAVTTMMTGAGTASEKSAATTQPSE